MLTARIEYRSAFKPHHITEEQFVPDEAAIFLTVALGKEVAESLSAWTGQQDHQYVAGRFYEVGQIGFRLGVPLRKLLLAIHQWTEKAFVARRSGGPNRRAIALHEKDQNIQDAATEFDTFVRHYVIRGYEDAVR